MNRLIGIGLALSLVISPVTSQAQSLLEKIATTIIADQFGIDNREVVYVQQQNRIPYWELGPVFEGSYYFKRSPSEVWRLRNQGLGWGQIAHKMGMHPGTFNKLRKQGAFDQDRFWIDSTSRRFGYPRESMVVLHKESGSLQDVLAAVILGKLSNRDPRSVYDDYKTRRSWTTVADTYDVRFEDWRRVSRPVTVVMPVSRYIAAPKPASTKVKVKGRSSLPHGKSEMSHGKSGKAHGKVKAKSGGPGNSKSQGGGQGKGKGKGKGGG